MTFAQRRISQNVSQSLSDARLYVKMRFVPRRKYFVWVEKRLMMHKEITDLRSEIHK